MAKERIAVLLLAAVVGVGCSDSSPTEMSKIESVEASSLTPKRDATLIGDAVGTLTGGTFTGTAQVTEFGLDEDRNLTVTGVLNGVVTIGGVATQIVNQVFSTTAEMTSGGESIGSMEGMVGSGHDDMTNARCQVLFLDLGPIFLNLLGLELNLSQIVLDLDAVSGAGNLVGNLLCAVVGLLDGFNLSGLLNLLDLINDLLG